MPVVVNRPVMQATGSQGCSSLLSMDANEELDGDACCAPLCMMQLAAVMLNGWEQ